MELCLDFRRHFDKYASWIDVEIYTLPNGGGGSTMILYFLITRNKYYSFLYFVGTSHHHRQQKSIRKRQVFCPLASLIIIPNPLVICHKPFFYPYRVSKGYLNSCVLLNGENRDGGVGIQPVHSGIEVEKNDDKQERSQRGR